MLSQGAKICLHIDYEDVLEEGLEHPALSLIHISEPTRPY